MSVHSDYRYVAHEVLSSTCKSPILTTVRRAHSLRRASPVTYLSLPSTHHLPSTQTPQPPLFSTFETAFLARMKLRYRPSNSSPAHDVQGLQIRLACSHIHLVLAGPSGFSAHGDSHIMTRRAIWAEEAIYANPHERLFGGDRHPGKSRERGKT
ncbi:hypothetical protein PMIN04_010125 [Paraphaeosphaeria minitans]